ncbi:plasmid stabilization protein [Sphingorhabdus sp.]|uniref:plasmid stabilization protein n=1 Tax=Sphingorhabdus sp. TaxID=1902408 RepID=UPI0039191395
MPQGSKAKYTDKQERKAEHIAEGYMDKGVSHKEAEARAWATVNKQDGGGNRKGGGGQAKPSSAKSSSRSEAAKKGWETRRKRHG